MNDFGSSAWSAVVTVSTTKKPQTSEDLQRAVTKGDVETVRNILPGKFRMLMFFSVITPPLSTKENTYGGSLKHKKILPRHRSSAK